MTRLVLVLAITAAAYLSPAGTAADEPAVARPLPDSAFATLGPIEVVVPVPASPSETARSAAPWPSARSGAALAWPALWAGPTGTISTYGPGYDGYLALPYPWGPGWVVRLCGPGGCVTHVSNDYGPERRLRRLADVDTSTFLAVCGVPWTYGLCQASVQVLRKAKR